MDIGAGLDGTLGLSLEDEAAAAQAAARLGYTSLWTPETTGYDAFQLCLRRWEASRAVAPTGLTTGISVSPAAVRTPIALAMSAGTVSAFSGGRFVLGIGAGGVYRPEGRRTLGLGNVSALAMMRDYLTTLRGLLAGERVDYEGAVVQLHGVRLAIHPPPRTPVYLAALGPKMLRLAGELADGVALNWCTPEQVAWSRERIAEGAERAGRDPAEVKVVSYIRVCVDDDAAAAQRALTQNVMGYALGRRPATPTDRKFGYRAHFERMGFAEALVELDRMQAAGAPAAELVDAFPAELVRRVAYFGQAAGAGQAFRRLAVGLDLAIVRVVATRPGLDGARATLEACEPDGAGT